MTLLLLGGGPGSGAAGGGGGGPPPLDGLSPTGAWSPSRKLLTSYVGSLYSLTTGHVSTLNDHSGNSRDLGTPATGTAPTIDSSGIVALSHNGTSDWLTSAAVASTFLSATAGYMIASIKPSGFTSDSGTTYVNAPILCDGGANASLTVRDNSGSPLLYATNWGGGQNVQKSIVANTVYVVEWLHDSGVLYLRLNGSGEVSVSSGNTSFSGPLNLGGRSLGTFFQGLIYEAATFSTIPTLAERDAMVQAFGTYVGASV